MPMDCTCHEVDMSEPLKCGPCNRCKRRADQMQHHGKGANEGQMEYAKTSSSGPSETRPPSGETSTAPSTSRPFARTSTLVRSARQTGSRPRNQRHLWATSEPAHRGTSLLSILLVRSPSRQERIAISSSQLMFSRNMLKFGRFQIRQRKCAQASYLMTTSLAGVHRSRFTRTRVRRSRAGCLGNCARRFPSRKRDQVRGIHKEMVRSNVSTERCFEW
ncbi:hypothetical protein DPMN_137213 [Dreissena polymorpha]|uniref:Uncharacterized protein n=1 Tax=Dreissena polymorpha TaxID=45954 RepID=A0A9D4G1F5_DREPO|nr:hypothetical protein DPMN_137213 [Dreissena polymorpha]